MLLSIIVPVYNAEPYFRPCLESIFKQGMADDDFEAILVNDGCNDNSFDTVKDITAAHHNISIIEQKNQGLSVARNNGLKSATGQYVLFADSDDIIIDHTLPQLLEYAMASQADMVIGDFVKLSSDEIADYSQPANAECQHFIVSGTDFFLQHFNPKECFVWRTLFRREFLVNNQLGFIPGIYYEDIPFTIECYLRAEKCQRVSLPFYLYRHHPNSIVASISMKKVKDMNHIVAHLCKRKESCSDEVVKKMDDAIYTTLSIAIWYVSHDRLLFSQRKEYIEDLKKQAPQLWLSNDIRQAFTSLLLRWMPSTYIWLRSLT